ALIRLHSCSPVSLLWSSPRALYGIYTLSLHDALPIWLTTNRFGFERDAGVQTDRECQIGLRLELKDRCRGHRGEKMGVQHPKQRDRKSTRLNSSHQIITYAVSCLKKKTRIVKKN